MNGIGKNEIQSDMAVSWLLILRWGALICQILLVLAVYLFFKTKTPLPILLIIIGFQGISNIAFQYLFQKQNITIPDWLFGLVMVLDIALLTALLYYTGGPMNPFTFLYLVHICVGAILMPPKWAWGLTGLTTLCYAGLFFLPNYFPDGGQLINNSAGASCHLASPGAGLLEDRMVLHLKGMWFAFTITAFFVVLFFNMIQKDFDRHQKIIVDLEKEKNRNEKLVSLATLAAGAAHEFSTPLATIAVAAGEMLRTLKRMSLDPELISDTELIREQVERCRDILYQMTADSGEHLAESLQEFSVTDLMNEILSFLPSSVLDRIQVNCCGAQDLSVFMPFRTVKRVIRNLINNAVEASGPNESVAVSCDTDDRFLTFTVVDQGTGMDDKTLSRAIEPFFTTKAPGKGLGLGLFLADSAAERFGGSLHLDSRPGEGTTAVISFALNQIQRH